MNDLQGVHHEWQQQGQHSSVGGSEGQVQLLSVDRQKLAVEEPARNFLLVVRMIADEVDKQSAGKTAGVGKKAGAEHTTAGTGVEAGIEAEAGIGAGTEAGDIPAGDIHPAGGIPVEGTADRILLFRHKDHILLLLRDQRREKRGRLMKQ